MFRISTLLVVLAVSNIQCDMTKSCKNEVGLALIDTAAEMITKAKLEYPNCKDCNRDVKQRALDCADLFHMGNHKSGVYEVQPVNRLTVDKVLKVYCDMETDGGGWTVIQRRGDFGSPRDYFFKDWYSYKVGFGDLHKDFWLGNDNIYALTNQKLYSARFDLQDVLKEKRYAAYDRFWMDDEYHKYTLHISGYMGNAGDSMTSPDIGGTQTTNNQKFSTKDQDNDSSRTQHCAALYKGGWWYNACHYSNLNGLYHKGRHNSFADGVNWNTWKGYQESLYWTEIKFRPINFRRSFAPTRTPV